MNESAVEHLGVLGAALRRRLYEVVRRRPDPVTRDQAAAAVGISRKLAAFHLDKLVDAGLLHAHYARPEGRTGPGAGRPAKLYRAADVEIEISLPPRRYRIPGEILLEALATRGPNEDAAAAAARVAYRRGQELGRAGDGRRDVVEILRAHGFEPRREGEALALGNCPFEQLARRSPEIVCVMNRAFVEGIARGAGDETSEAVLVPGGSGCCVSLRASHGGA